MYPHPSPLLTVGNALSTPVPTFSNVVLLVHGGGANGSTSFTDLSSYGRTLTANGNVQHSSTTTIGGENSILFDGTGDFISTPHNANLSVGTSTDFCLEAYIIVDTTAKISTIMNKRPSSLASGYSFAVNSGGALIFQTFNGSTTALNISGATALSTGTLYHVAASRQGTAGRVFVNGVLDATGTQSGSVSDGTAAFNIGRDGFNTGRDFQGKMNWARATIGQALYTGNFTPPTMPLPTS